MCLCVFHFFLFVFVCFYDLKKSLFLSYDFFCFHHSLEQNVDVFFFHLMVSLQRFEMNSICLKKQLDYFDFNDIFAVDVEVGTLTE